MIEWHPSPCRRAGMMNIAANDPLGAAVMSAIHSGDLGALERLLIENPHLLNFDDQ